MIRLFYLFLFGVAFTLSSCNIVYAVEVDPTKEPTKTLNCTAPLEYTDNTPIPEGDITEIRLYRSDTDGGPYVQVASGAQCRFVVDTSAMTDGQSFYYVVTAISARYGTESDYSNQRVLDIVVQRTPNAPTQLNWE